MSDSCYAKGRCNDLPPPDQFTTQFNHAGDNLRAQGYPVAPPRQEYAAQPVVLGPVGDRAPLQQQLVMGPVGNRYAAEPPNGDFETPRWFPIDIQSRNGSLRLGLNAFGLAKGGISLGAETGPYAGSEVLRTDATAGLQFGPNHVGVGGRWSVIDGALTNGAAGVGIDADRRGLDVNGGAQVSALTVFGAGGRGGVRLGEDVGPYARAGAYAGPANVNAGGEAYLNQYGVHARGGGDVGVDPVLGVSGEGRVGIGAPTEAHGDVGLQVGNGAVRTGAGFYPPDARPNAYVAASNGVYESTAQLNPPYRDRGYQPYPLQGAERTYAAPVIPVEQHPLPPPRMEATPHNIDVVTNQIRQRVTNESSYTAHNGQTYLDIMCELRPGSTREDLKPEAGYLAQMNHNKRLHDGVSIMTLTPTEVDWKTRVEVSQYFGWAPPKS